MIFRESRAALIGLDPNYAKRLADALNVYLANLHVVYVKLHNFHWNVVGVDEVDKFVKETTDEYTINLIGDALGFLEKNVWFFSAYLEKVDYGNMQK